MTTDTATPAPRHDGFSPGRQRAFLEALACEGYVDRACAATDISRETVYRQRQRRDGAAFALGWDAALLLARVRVADMLMMRAIEGQVDVTVRDADSGEWRRHRSDNRLALALLGRLDRFADANDAGGHSPHADARLIAQDWDAFLEMIEHGHEGAGAALFLTARRTPKEGESPSPEPCQFCSLKAEEQDDEDEEIETFLEERRTAGFTVWNNGKELRTGFPPPKGFAGTQEHSFGNFDYSRSLTREETMLHHAGIAADMVPRLKDADARRESYFARCRDMADTHGIDIASFANA